MLWVGAVLYDGGSSPVDSAVIDAVQRGQWGPGDPLSCLYHSLQAFAVHGRSAAVPRADAVGQTALHDTAVEVAEDLCRHAKLPQPPQKIQPLLCFLDQLCCVGGPCEVLSDVDPEVLKAAHPLHFKIPDKQWLVRSPLLPHVHYHLLRLVCV